MSIGDIFVLCSGSEVSGDSWVMMVLAWVVLVLWGVRGSIR